MQSKHPIYVTISGGLVTNVSNIPPSIEVQVIDHDVEGESDLDRVQPSPLDGSACCLTIFQSL
jgi:hypothetical protein